MAVSLETSSKKQQFGELVLRRPSSKIAISLETSSENRDVDRVLLFASSWNAPGRASKWPKTVPKSAPEDPKDANAHSGYALHHLDHHPKHDRDHDDPHHHHHPRHHLHHHSHHRRRRLSSSSSSSSSPSSSSSSSSSKTKSMMT